MNDISKAAANNNNFLYCDRHEREPACHVQADVPGAGPAAQQQRPQHRHRLGAAAELRRPGPPAQQRRTVPPAQQCRHPRYQPGGQAAAAPPH